MTAQQVVLTQSGARDVRIASKIEDLDLELVRINNPKLGDARVCIDHSFLIKI